MRFCRTIGERDPPNTCSILSPDAPPPTPPVCPPQRLVREQLLPPTPSVHLETKKHVFSPQLQEFCLKHPIAVVRGLAAALNLGRLIEYSGHYSNSWFQWMLDRLHFYRIYLEENDTAFCWYNK